MTAWFEIKVSKKFADDHIPVYTAIETSRYLTVILKGVKIPVIE